MSRVPWHPSQKLTPPFEIEGHRNNAYILVYVQKCYAPRVIDALKRLGTFCHLRPTSARPRDITPQYGVPLPTLLRQDKSHFPRAVLCCAGDEQQIGVSVQVCIAHAGNDRNRW